MQVGWIDFSPEERNRTLTVLSSLSEPGSVDELGVGIVRDAMADLLFPGTSTLLTKARYFFLVPYLSRLLEEGHDDSRQDPRALRNTFRDLERRCAAGLRKNAKASGLSDEGIIGRVALASGKWVARGPGEIYWASLRTLGFMRDGAPDSYQAQFGYLADMRMRDQRGQFVGAKGEDDDGLSDDRLAFRSMWCIPRGLYRSWKKDWRSWDSTASIALTHDEAAYLRAHVIASHPDSLYALLLSDDQLRAVALASLYGETGVRGDSSFHEFLAQGLARIQELSPVLAKTCVLADNFSELVLGCRIIGKELQLSTHPSFKVMAAFLARSAACMDEGDLEGLKEQVRKREVAIKGARRKIGAKGTGDFAWRGGHRLPYRFANALAIIREIDEAGGCDA